MEEKIPLHMNANVLQNTVARIPPKLVLWGSADFSMGRLETVTRIGCQWFQDDCYGRLVKPGPYAKIDYYVQTPF